MSNPPLIDLTQLDAPGDRAIVVALSGGLDSTVLLHALAQLPGVRQRGLRAVHVHHGLHVDADAWARHCAVLCSALDVPLRTAHVKVERDRGNGPEAAAREARYRAFEAELADGEVLALAHHQADQAETFLLRALRGSGPDGLAAMRASRRLGLGTLWRPLLRHPRSALVDYAQAHDLHWIEDPSNADRSFDRNYLRGHVLPLLRERWPHVDAALAQAAALSGEAADLLDNDDAAALAMLRRRDRCELDLPGLRACTPPRRARLLRRWIAELGLPPLPGKGIAILESEVLSARPDAQAEFRWHGVRIRAWAGRLLHADRIRAPLPAAFSIRWHGAAPLELPDGGRLSLDPVSRFETPVEVRARRGGETLRLPRREHRASLRQALQDFDVPPWRREHLPLLIDARGEVFAAGDLILSADADAWLRSAGTRIVWTAPADFERGTSATPDPLTPAEPDDANTVD